MAHEICAREISSFTRFYIIVSARKWLQNQRKNIIFNIFKLNYVHPPGGWIYYFCFFRRPMSGVRCPASRMVSAHLKEKY